MDEEFPNKLSFGKAGEKDVQEYLTRKGFSVMYTGSASQEDPVPSIWLPKDVYPDPLIAPDLFVTQRITGASIDPSSFFVEVKRYSSWTWSRDYHEWQTGMSVKNYFHYCKVQELLGYPVSVYFVIEGEPSKQRPTIPTKPGVFAAPLHNLEVSDKKHQYRSVSIWWSIEEFNLLCTLEELRAKVKEADGG